MVGVFDEGKTDELMALWLDNITKVHSFIKGDYWKGLYEKFKEEYIQKGDNFVYEQEGKLVAFATIIDEGDIIAFFVDGSVQNQGIGTELLTFLKSKYPQLSISIYKKNRDNLNFFYNRGFKALYEQVDNNTDEEEVYLQWRAE